MKLGILRTLTCYRMTRHSSGHSFSISLKSYSSTHTKWLNLKWSPGQFRIDINTRRIVWHFAFAGIKRKAPNLCLLERPFTQPLPCSTIPVTLQLSGIIKLSFCDQLSVCALITASISFRFYVEDKVCVQAIKNISKGEEISENYGPIFFHSGREDRKV